MKKFILVSLFFVVGCTSQPEWSTGCGITTVDNGFGDRSSYYWVDESQSVDVGKWGVGFMGRRYVVGGADRQPEYISISVHEVAKVSGCRVETAKKIMGNP